MKENTKDNKTEETEVVEKRCFVMMPISDQGDYPKGHFDKVYNQIFKPAIERAGYIPYRVDENTISDPIINKIFDAVQNCEMALCDLSNRNPNVLYELGLRQAYNKPVVLVCDDKTDKIFDVSGISTVFYNNERLYENVVNAQDKIYEALITTREGKAATLVQVVRATEASYKDLDLNKDDTVNIMLQSIMNEMQNISRNNNVKGNSEDSGRIIEMSFENIFGRTHKDLIRITESMTRLTGAHINGFQIKENKIITIYLNYEYFKMIDEISSYLEAKIGPEISIKI